MDRQQFDSQYESIARDLSTPESESRLQSLLDGGRWPAGLRTWNRALLWLHQPSGKLEQKDRFIRTVLSAHRTDREPTWTTALTAAFWPWLRRQHDRRRHWDVDRDDLWQELLWAFLETTNRIDLSRCPDRVICKITFGTFHLWHDRYLRRWDQQARLVELPDDESWDWAGAVEDSQFARVDAAHAITRWRCLLDRERDAGRLSDLDFLLLVGHYVRGRSVQSCAKAASIGYEAAKKRVQRARRRMNHIFLSPSGRRDLLSKDEGRSMSRSRRRH